MIFSYLFVFSETQFVCYVGLWRASGSKTPSDSQPYPIPVGSNSSEEGEANYSIFAIAGAMYLLLSIAVADLWGGCGLCFEGLGTREGFVWFTGRRAFGVGLVVTFATLIGASVRVLFSSSFESVELVIGAAAILFVADVVSYPGCGCVGHRLLPTAYTTLQS